MIKRPVAFAGVAAVIALVMSASAGPQKLLVCHLDFNSVQMNTGAVVRTLDHMAAKGYNAVLWEIEDKVRFACAPELARRICPSERGANEVCIIWTKWANHAYPGFLNSP